MNNRTCNSARGRLPLAFPCKSPEPVSAYRNNMATIVICLFAMVVVAGCASTKVSTQPLVTEQLPRPATIWVYDFSALETPTETGCLF